MQGTDRGRFSNKTRNGNWWEEMVLEDEKLREFLEKKEKGTLTIQRIRQNLGGVHLGSVSTERGVSVDDGKLHYGQAVRICNGEFGCFLACDPGDAENAEEGLYSASGSRQQEPSARNVWYVQKLDDCEEFLPLPVSNEEGSDTVVRYGDKFALKTTEAIGEPFYLGSTGIDWSHFSRASRKQLVYCTSQCNFKCAWRIDSIGRDSSFDLEGEPVELGSKVFIKHCSTGSPLACRESQVLNDYGSEYELVGGREPGKKMIWEFTTK
jgi:hypothetical protein